MAERRRPPTRATTKLGLTILACFTLIAVLPAPSGAYPRPAGRTERVSVTSDGSQGRYPVLAQRQQMYEGVNLSSTGRFAAFTSRAELVEGDTNLVSDVFVRDRRTGTTERVSISSDGSQALVTHPSYLLTGTGSESPSISGDGRYVAFASIAVNLSGETLSGEIDTDNEWDVFVHDRKAGRTEQVSLSHNGNQLDSCRSCSVDISDNGRYVAFNSGAHIYVHDRKTGRTELVSVSSQGEEGNSTSYSSSISLTGRYVVFTSTANNLVPNDTNGYADAFLRDRKSKKTELISVARDGQGANEGAFTRFLGAGGSHISANGRYVLFVSSSTNLIPNPSGSYNVYVRDRATGRTTRVSVRSEGQGGSSDYDASISYDGNLVAFNGIGYDQRNSSGGIVVHEVRSGATRSITFGPRGEPASASRSSGCMGPVSMLPAFSGNGRFVAYSSCASNLVSNDTNEMVDIFVRDYGTPLGVGAFGDSPGQDVPPPPGGPICIPLNVCIPPGGAVTTSDERSDVSSVLTKQGANLYGASLAYRPQSARGGGGDVTISGWATFSGQIMAGTDDKKDDAGAYGELNGAEMIGSDFIYRPENEDFFFRLEVTKIPVLFLGVVGRALLIGSPLTLYGLDFTIAGDHYQIRASAAGVNLSDPGGHALNPGGNEFGLFECDEEKCLPVADLTGGYGTTGERIVVALPVKVLHDLGTKVEEGDKVSGLYAFTARAPYIGPSPTEAEIWDDARLTKEATVEIPKKSVTVTVGKKSVVAKLKDGYFDATFPRKLFRKKPTTVKTKTCLGNECVTQKFKVKA